jgi:hypothetical protein
MQCQLIAHRDIKYLAPQNWRANLERALRWGARRVEALQWRLGAISALPTTTSGVGNNDQYSPVENHTAREHAMIDFRLGLQSRVIC